MSQRGSVANVLAPPAIAKPWTAVCVVAAAGMVALVALYFSTVASAVHLWNTSAAYNYAYLILPISAGLIWSERAELAKAVPIPTLWGIGVAGAFSAVWLLADLLGIDEGRHLAFVGMMQGLALALLGWRIYRFLAFPLLYLFFLVPTGTFLLTPLQTLAHQANVFLLKASGVPVFAEGFLIQVPAGSFLVEPGCAGLNFLLVAFALSLLYGRLTYESTFARVMCVVVALLTSIAANIIRIYLIIGLAQFTDRRIDISADHLLYGWGFFGVVMLAAMWLGMKIKAAPAQPRKLPAQMSAPPVWQTFLAVVIFIPAVAVSPALAATSGGRAALETHVNELIGRVGVLPTRVNGE